MANEVISAEDRVIEYVPFGETKPIKLSVAIVRSHIAVPTAKGAHPSDSELIKFMMLCQARELNPWVGDAFLVGYDSQDGPKFSLITAVQALFKRAEANPNFDGIESGVIVIRGQHELVERQGDLVLQSEIIVGGWARCWRRDRSHAFYDSLTMGTYNKGYSQWKKDPAGMIVKCAEASVLRKAFPTQLGGLYIEQERGNLERREMETSSASPTERITRIGPEVASGHGGNGNGTNGNGNSQAGQGTVQGSDLTKGPKKQDKAQEAKPEPVVETKPAPAETKEPQGETKPAGGEPSAEEMAEIRTEEAYGEIYSAVRVAKSEPALNKVSAAVGKDELIGKEARGVIHGWIARRREALKAGNGQKSML